MARKLSAGLRAETYWRENGRRGSLTECERQASVSRWTARKYRDVVLGQNVPSGQQEQEGGQNVPQNVPPGHDYDAHFQTPSAPPQPPTEAEPENIPPDPSGPTAPGGQQEQEGGQNVPPKRRVWRVDL